MKKLIQIVLSVITLFSCNGLTVDKKQDPSTVLWYDKPAEVWTDALPLGNGRLGAMVYGGVERDTIQFNEETLWTGQPHSYVNRGAHESLEQIRQLLFEGDQIEAQKLAQKDFMSQPLGQLSYQPFGNIILNFPEDETVENYSRTLDLAEATTTVRYSVGGVKYSREVFISEPDQALLVHLEASKKSQLNFTVDLNSKHSRYDVIAEGDEIIIRGEADDYSKEVDKLGVSYPKSRVTFEARLKVLNEGGNLEIEGSSIKVIDANSVTLQLVAATSFKSYSDISGNPTELCKGYLKNLDGKSYIEIKESHIEDFGELFNRVDLDLGESEISNRPTDERIASFKIDEDPNLVSLLYQYGRYLLISSSRAGTQPANLQGIWNQELSPSWDSKYTININTEMNYWLAENGNLSELTDPLVSMLEDLSVTGQEVAKEQYNLDGWVTHHNTDIWRGASPIDGSGWGIWVSGGAWLSQHLWWHYQFTNDKDFLKNRAYPILKEASRFFTGFLISDPNNPEWLISGPSNSPEIGGLVMAPTIDHQIIRNLFSNTIEAAEILGVDSDLMEVIKEKRDSIAPNLIGKHGQIQEWLVDIDDPKDQHRHISHLWGLFPGSEITPFTTPKFAEASNVTLNQRGDDGPGWSLTWKINCWARLLDADHAFLQIKNFITPSIDPERGEGYNRGLYINLFNACPPFQIDGNFGFSSGVAEMILQSHLRDERGDYIQDILPAIPSQFATGKISGVKGRGSFEISIEWKDSELVSVEVKSLEGNSLNLRYRGELISQETKKGETLLFTSADFK